MIRAVWLLSLIGGAACNQILGIEKTNRQPDALEGAGPVCAPLPYDPLRYQPYNGGMPIAYAAARAACQSRAMDLAVLDEGDPDELAHEQAGALTPFWTGVAHIAGAWTALDGCRPYFTWAPGEPSDERDTDCLRVDADGMASRNCSETQDEHGASIGFLCETPRPSAECQAHASGALVANHGSFPVAYAQAGTFCPAGTHVVEIDSSAELGMAMTVAAQGSAIPFWVGAQYAADSNAWTSVTGCPAVFAWAAGQPDLTTGLSCVIADTNGMSMHDCNDPNVGRVLCEQD